MTILYHLTSPAPYLPETDAVFQEVQALHNRFGGDIINLYPFHRPGIRWPRALYGWHKLRELRSRESTACLHHVFANELFPFPLFLSLNRPVIYSIVASVQAQRIRPRPAWFPFVKTIVVSNPRDLTSLQQWGFNNCQLVRPGIDVARFSHTPLTPGPEFVILAGSAPWVSTHFRQKGFDLLLKVARDLPMLHLVLLWRGVLFDEIKEKVKQHGLVERIEIINHKVDVNEVLARVHAAIVLADRPEIVKAYPHSLLEALAAGKPVLVSRAIPMADYVNDTRCGEVVRILAPDELHRAISRLMKGYEHYQINAMRIAQKDFSASAMLAAYEKIYATE